jgi:hypothetical protein
METYVQKYPDKMFHVEHFSMVQRRRAYLLSDLVFIFKSM